mmetsp:Transcript_67573/g.218217  ORF Transcript_67573/g.218217 Transcript_67573/m.218217 type:complete len:203 (+) Transcript_67573:136-744(+)
MPALAAAAAPPAGQRQRSTSGRRCPAPRLSLLMPALDWARRRAQAPEPRRHELCWRALPPTSPRSFGAASRPLPRLQPSQPCPSQNQGLPRRNASSQATGRSWKPSAQGCRGSLAVLRPAWPNCGSSCTRPGTCSGACACRTARWPPRVGRWSLCGRCSGPSSAWTVGTSSYRTHSGRSALQASRSPTRSSSSSASSLRGSR